MKTYIDKNFMVKHLISALKSTKFGPVRMHSWTWDQLKNAAKKEDPVLRSLHFLKVEIDNNIPKVQIRGK